MSFLKSFEKTAVTDLSEQARNEATASFEVAIPGTSLRSTAETGQRRKANTRTDGVLNEDRQFDPKYKVNWRTARAP